MTLIELDKTLSFTKNARVLQFYFNNYCTVIDENYLYLIESTQINPQRLIAKIDIKENCEIFNRDKANVFVTWFNNFKYFSNDDEIESSEELLVKQAIIDFLSEDINELITFNQKDFTFIKSLIEQFDLETQNKIYKAFKLLDIDDSLSFTEAYSFNQIDYLLKKQYYYICLNLSKKKYAVSSSNFKKYYTNGACGDWSKLIKNDNFKVLFFNKSDTSYFDKETEALLKKDLEQKSIPAIITHLLKLEDKMTKSLNEMINILANNYGIIKIEAVSYPDVKDTIESLEALLVNYQNAITKIDKFELFKLLKEKYSHIYLEFGKAQESLKYLYSLYKTINTKETINA